MAGVWEQANPSPKRLSWEGRYPASKGVTEVSAHGDEGETAEAKKIIDMEWLKWPKGLTEEDGKLYRNGRLLVPEFRVLELCEAWLSHYAPRG